MATEIYSWGAAGEVTGSKHFLETPSACIQVDCGVFQGRRQETHVRNSSLPYDAARVDVCVLTHGHLDHCGNLPTLLKQGFEGPIYSTPATMDIARLILMDSAHIQESDAKFARKLSQKKRRKDGFISEPLYGYEDVERTLKRFKPIRYRERTPIAPGTHLTFYDAGHILGSAMALLEVDEGGKTRRVVFGGDMGRRGLPILRDPQMPPDPNVFVCESTYGNHLHDEIGLAKGELARVIQETSAKGGKVVIPSFAIGRTQELIFFLHLLSDEGTIPEIPIFVDSPMAVTATSIFKAHPECYDQETKDAFTSHSVNPFGFERLTLIRDVEESKKLNGLNGPAIIISASGMAEAGRILHHLMNTIEDPKNTVLIVGYQAEHTLGRRIADRSEEVKIFGEEFKLRARVKVMNAFSAHADYNEILGLFSGYSTTSLEKIFLVHGEGDARDHLRIMFNNNGFGDVTLVDYENRYRL
ncbi:MAG: MBL fold metallo-hydrolase [Candidatus Eisenbacteria bacterium]